MKNATKLTKCRVHWTRYEMVKKTLAVQQRENY